MTQAERIGPDGHPNRGPDGGAALAKRLRRLRETAALPEPVPGSKAAAVLAAARDVFLDQGFERASMDTIARVAGVSKATVYAHFRSKEELFVTMLARAGEATARMLSADAMDPGDLRGSLARIGDLYLRRLTDPDMLSTMRVVAHEVTRMPELGRAVYETGPRRVREALSAYLAGAGARGELAIDDPLLAAEQFIGLVQGPIHLKTMLGVLPADEIGAAIGPVVAAAVERFLRAYAPGPS